MPDSGFACLIVCCAPGFSEMSRSFSIVVAATRMGGIGYKGGMPWPRLPRDLAFFKRLTSTGSPSTSSSSSSPPSSSSSLPGYRRCAVIMGRKTFESIPPAFRALAGRVPIVVTRDPSNVASK